MAVAVLMGSDSDLEQVEPCLDMLESFGVPFQARVFSAHRTPHLLSRFIQENDAELGIYICAAGGAAHLAGVVASLTMKPVIGIPILSASLGGADSLYSMVQMPAGVPVATMGLGKAGAANAGLLAVQILSLSSPELAKAFAEYKQETVASVAAKDLRLQEKLKEKRKQ